MGRTGATSAACAHSQQCAGRAGYDAVILAGNHVAGSILLRCILAGFHPARTEASSKRCFRHRQLVLVSQTPQISPCAQSNPRHVVSAATYAGCCHEGIAVEGKYDSEFSGRNSRISSVRPKPSLRDICAPRACRGACHEGVAACRAVLPSRAAVAEARRRRAADSVCGGTLPTFLCTG